MKTVLVLFCSLFSAACLCAEEPKKSDLSSDKDKASYVLGLTLAQPIKPVIKDIDLDILAKSAREALSGQRATMSDDDMDKLLAGLEYIAAKRLAATGKATDAPTPALENKDKISYALGRSVTERLTTFSEFLNLDVLCGAFLTAAKGEPLALNPADHKAAVEAYLIQVRTDFLKRNKKRGEDFLDENKKKEGVITTQTGLQYKILKEGNGEKPSGTDLVTVNFEGRFINGKVFVSSSRSGKPIEFNIDGTITGLIEALRMMPTGSKWEIYVPIDLAYGEAGRQGEVPENSVLIYDIELLSFKKVELK